MSHFKNLTVSQCIVMEYQNLQNVDGPVYLFPTIYLETVTYVYSDSSEIRYQHYLLSREAFP